MAILFNPTRTLKVLQVSPEVAPFIKTESGLGALVSETAKIQKKWGIDTRIFMPMYKVVTNYLNKNEIEIKNSREVITYENGSPERIIIKATNLPGSDVLVYFAENDKYFGFDQLDKIQNPANADDYRKFKVFSDAVVTFLISSQWRPDIIHCYNWQSARIPYDLIATPLGQFPSFKEVKTVFTLHDLNHENPTVLLKSALTSATISNIYSKEFYEWLLKYHADLLKNLPPEKKIFSLFGKDIRQFVNGAFKLSELDDETTEVIARKHIGLYRKATETPRPFYFIGINQARNECLPQLKWKDTATEEDIYLTVYGDKDLDVPKSILTAAKEAGQLHLFNEWDNLTLPQKKKLLAFIEKINFGEIEILNANLLQDSGRKVNVGKVEEPSNIIRIPNTATEIKAAKKAFETGEKTIENGEIAILTVAGGQASRLGLSEDTPKGKFKLTLVTNASLYRSQARRILALSQKHKDKDGHPARIIWYIMTSSTTHQPTVEYFMDNHFFGLGAENVIFFQQDNIASVDNAGKIIMKDKATPFFNPNGNGDVFRALHKEKVYDLKEKKEVTILEHMENHGVKIVCYDQVDNYANLKIDPAQVGYHIINNATITTKVVKKRHPQERVGVLADIDGETKVIEYSELEEFLKRMKKEKEKSGEKVKHTFVEDFIEKLDLANTCMQTFDLGFLKNVDRKLNYHISRNRNIKINEGKRQKKTIKGNKYEKFYFDVYPQAENIFVIEIPREKEFMPIKGQEIDSPEQALRIKAEQNAKYFKKLGWKIPIDANGNSAVKIEYSPAFALNEKEVNKKVGKNGKMEFDSRLYLSGENTTLGEGLDLGGVLIVEINRERDEFGGPPINLGENLTIKGHVHFTIERGGRLTINDGVTIDSEYFDAIIGHGAHLKIEKDIKKPKEPQIIEVPPKETKTIPEN